MISADRLGRDARACHAAAVAAVEPGALVTTAMTRATARRALEARVRLLAAGKAAAAMARAGLAALGGKAERALVVVPAGTVAGLPAEVAVVEAGHPIPTEGSLRAGEAALGFASACGPGTRLLALLSGGTSALLVAPVPPISLAELQALTRHLLGAGADIGAMNAVRKHCSRVKGGGLARAAARADAIVTFVLSDVLGDDLATVASGVTVADPTTYADALGVLDRFGGRAAAPASVVRHLEAGARGEVPETLKAGDGILARSSAEVIGGNATAVAAAARAAEARGYATTVIPPLTGDAGAAGRHIAALVRGLPADRPCALVAGAEPTVRAVPGGRGGRAQHLALSAAADLAGLDAVVLAAGTDGIDGPTDAAGALVDGTIAGRAAAAGIDVGAALAATDSHPVLDQLGALLRTGPTGTNVTDVVVALRAAC